MDSFHCCGSSSLFQTELTSLWTSEINVYVEFKHSFHSVKAFSCVLTNGL